MSPSIDAALTPEAARLAYVHDAFISYSRVNEAIADQLERAFESYKPPKSLDVPQRRLNIFRDRSDFTGGEYYQNLDRHLTRSAKLIVVCSPQARASRHVNDEIRRFVDMRGPSTLSPSSFPEYPTTRRGRISRS